MRPLTALERLLLPLVRRFVTLWVRPSVLPDDVAARFLPGRPIVYVLEKRGLVDVAVLEFVCRERNLPLPLAPVGDGLLPAAVAFLERRAGWLGMRIDRRMPEALRTLTDKAATDLGFDAELVPVSLYWGRAPGREREWFRLLVAEGWDIGGRVRKALSLLVNGRNLLILFGEGVVLQPSLAETRGLPRGPRRLSRQLRAQFRNQRVATIGPDLSHRRTIVAQVLRTQAVRDAVRGEMKAKGSTRHDGLDVARRYAFEVAANYSHWFVTLMYGLLSRLWNRLYDGVELANFSSLESVAEGSEIVYVPCHRSHMDYLLLSYVVYHKGYAVPHIAAGINLNLPVVGSLLRRGGAFFLRRSFAGNALYSAVFLRYLGLMMARGHSIEYFVEGGRSRTGRLLKPKTGMLAMTVRSYLREPRLPLVFVPVYFGYERLVEGRTYIGELSGRPKEKESLASLVKVIPALRSRFGKVYVSFGEPLALDPLIERHAPGWGRVPAGTDDRPEWLSPLVRDVATRIMTRINAAACVTPINLIGLVLLGTPRQSLGESDLVRQLELYASLLRQAPYSPRVWVTAADGASMIRYGESLKVLRRQPHELGDVIFMTPEQSVLQTYFRNNALHLLLMPSLIACAFLSNPSVARDDLQRFARRVYPYVQEEYFLRWTEDELPGVVDELLEDLLNHGLLTSSEDHSLWQRPPVESSEAVQLSMLARVTVPILERYYLAISLLLKAGTGRLTEDALARQCQLMAQRMALLYDLNSPEFFDRAQFSNFVERLVERRVLSRSEDGRLEFDNAVLEGVATDAQVVLSEQLRNSILQVVHR
ncbi:MAG: glycerol-3-phosphate 1-O-acyltransferase PlsB [Lysobacterales bacterium]|jgi:glycerol-3-phosphate O-acyltransferase|nr:MAG: glycerol-3-phosphate 1-O-acyltransferase PlsB [Xanthomonadales bacterium]